MDCVYFNIVYVFIYVKIVLSDIESWGIVVDVLDINKKGGGVSERGVFLVYGQDFDSYLRGGFFV